MLRDEDKVGELPRKTVKMINELKGSFHVERIILISSASNLKQHST